LAGWLTELFIYSRDMGISLLEFDA